ncbi:MAG TPA: LPS export ABC transporter permease LptF [Burkholderiales bacterium]|jgi:lipopolysaccharide export system permease protein|nr:LPS export ABC transporter permease LptF [Burkholderiales bacterium]
MIFQRSLLREFAITGIATFVVLLAITITTQLIRFLGYAARGNISTDAVLTFLGFASLRYLPILLSLTLFISVLMTLTRSYRDSEMVVWFTSGRGLYDWIRPVLIYATPLVAVIAILSLFLSPWAMGKTEEYRRQLENQDDVAAISPGVFKESRRAERVYFVEKLAANLSTVANIFVHSEEDGQVGTTVAKRGYQETAPNGDRFLVLLNGRRYIGPPGSAEYRIIEFEKYSLRIEQSEPKEAVPTAKSTSTPDLLRKRSPEAKAELIWRAGLPLSAFVLCLLAIPMSFVNPRAGRSLNLMLAALLYMVYSNLLSIQQAWVAQQKIGPFLGMWAVHAGMLAIVALMFYVRLSVRPFRMLRGG